MYFTLPRPGVRAGADNLSNAVNAAFSVLRGHDFESSRLGGAIPAPRSFPHRPRRANRRLNGQRISRLTSALNQCATSPVNGSQETFFHCALVVDQKHGRHDARARPGITGAVLFATPAAGMRRRIARQHPERHEANRASGRTAATLAAFVTATVFHSATGVATSLPKATTLQRLPRMRRVKRSRPPAVDVPCPGILLTDRPGCRPFPRGKKRVSESALR
jgi:hypothetical protein